jgi:hypothetical protein
MKTKHGEYITLVDVEISVLENMLKLISLFLERPTRHPIVTNVAAIIEGRTEANGEMARSW